MGRRRVVVVVGGFGSRVHFVVGVGVVAVQQRRLHHVDRSTQPRGIAAHVPR